MANCDCTALVGLLDPDPWESRGWRKFPGRRQKFRGGAKIKIPPDKRRGNGRKKKGKGEWSKTPPPGGIILRIEAACNKWAAAGGRSVVIANTAKNVIDGRAGSFPPEALHESEAHVSRPGIIPTP